jgi:exopolyphosphatase/guanosine-5'-triphosphate,3'-diphosphate pyrophosphatase
MISRMQTASESSTLAAVDVGTNTVRCLLAEWDGRELARLRVLRDITRLGEGLRANGRLSPAAEERTLAALARFGVAVRQAGTARGRAVATSASRDAASPGFVARMGEALGFPVEIIGGEEEARLTAQGMQGGVGERDGIALDIGGGSTEVVRVRGGEMLWWESLPEGVVHLTEAFLRHDPPLASEREALAARVSSLLAGLPDEGGIELIATAGTPTTLAAIDLALDEYDPALVNGHHLALPRLRDLTGRLLALPAAERLALPGMEKGREDIIAAGSLFLLAAAERWGFSGVVASDWGLLEGIALDAARRGGGHRRQV